MKLSWTPSQLIFAVLTTFLLFEAVLPSSPDTDDESESTDLNRDDKSLFELSEQPLESFLGQGEDETRKVLTRVRKRERQIKQSGSGTSGRVRKKVLKVAKVPLNGDISDHRVIATFDPEDEEGKETLRKIRNKARIVDSATLTKLNGGDLKSSGNEGHFRFQAPININSFPPAIDPFPIQFLRRPIKQQDPVFTQQQQGRRVISAAQEQPTSFSTFNRVPSNNQQQFFGISPSSQTFNQQLSQFSPQQRFNQQNNPVIRQKTQNQHRNRVVQQPQVPPARTRFNIGPQQRTPVQEFSHFPTVRTRSNVVDQPFVNTEQTRSNNQPFKSVLSEFSIETQPGSKSSNTFQQSFFRNEDSVPSNNQLRNHDPLTQNERHVAHNQPNVLSSPTNLGESRRPQIEVRPVSIDGTRRPLSNNENNSPAQVAKDVPRQSSEDVQKTVKFQRKKAVQRLPPQTPVKLSKVRGRPIVPVDFPGPSAAIRVPNRVSTKPKAEPVIQSQGENREIVRNDDKIQQILNQIPIQNNNNQRPREDERSGVFSNDISSPRPPLVQITSKPLAELLEFNTEVVRDEVEISHDKRHGHDDEFLNPSMLMAQVQASKVGQLQDFDYNTIDNETFGDDDDKYEAEIPHSDDRKIQDDDLTIINLRENGARQNFQHFVDTDAIDDNLNGKKQTTSTAPPNIPFLPTVLPIREKKTSERSEDVPIDDVLPEQVTESKEAFTTFGILSTTTTEKTTTQGVEKALAHDRKQIERLNRIQSDLDAWALIQERQHELNQLDSTTTLAPKTETTTTTSKPTLATTQKPTTTTVKSSKPPKIQLFKIRTKAPKNKIVSTTVKPRSLSDLFKIRAGQKLTLSHDSKDEEEGKGRREKLSFIDQSKILESTSLTPDIDDEERETQKRVAHELLTKHAKKKENVLKKKWKDNLSSNRQPKEDTKAHDHTHEVETENTNVNDGGNATVVMSVKKSVQKSISHSISTNEKKVASSPATAVLPPSYRVDDPVSRKTTLFVDSTELPIIIVNGKGKGKKEGKEIDLSSVTVEKPMEEKSSTIASLSTTPTTTSTTSKPLTTSTKSTAVFTDDISELLPAGYRLPSTSTTSTQPSSTLVEEILSTISIDDIDDSLLTKEFKSTIRPKKVKLFKQHNTKPPSPKFSNKEFERKRKEKERARNKKHDLNDNEKEKPVSNLMDNIKFDDISQFLPAGFSIGSESKTLKSTTTTSPPEFSPVNKDDEVELLKPEITNVDISTFLPKDFEEPKEEKKLEKIVLFPSKADVAKKKTDLKDENKRKSPGPTLTKIVSFSDILKNKGANLDWLDSTPTKNVSQISHNTVGGGDMISTSTTTTTTTTTTTVTPPPLPDLNTRTPGTCGSLLNCKFAATLRLMDGAKWSDRLLNRNTYEWQDLADSVTRELTQTYRNSLIGDSFDRIEIEAFSKGSVLVDYFVYFNHFEDEIRTDELKRVINAQMKRSQNESRMGSFTVDPRYTDFIVLEPEKSSPSISDIEDESALPNWAIAVIAIGIGSFTIVIVLGVTVLANKRRRAMIARGSGSSSHKFASQLKSNSKKQQRSKLLDSPLDSMTPTQGFGSNPHHQPDNMMTGGGPPHLHHPSRHPIPGMGPPPMGHINGVAVPPPGMLPPPPYHMFNNLVGPPLPPMHPAAMRAAAAAAQRQHRSSRSMGREFIDNNEMMMRQTADEWDDHTEDFMDDDDGRDSLMDQQHQRNMTRNQRIKRSSHKLGQGQVNPNGRSRRHPQDFNSIHQHKSRNLSSDKQQMELHDKKSRNKSSSNNNGANPMQSQLYDSWKTEWDGYYDDHFGSSAGPGSGGGPNSHSNSTATTTSGGDNSGQSSSSGYAYNSGTTTTNNNNNLSPRQGDRNGSRQHKTGGPPTSQNTYLTKGGRRQTTVYDDDF